MTKATLFVILFNAPFDSGLDYAVQTMRILARRHVVYGFSLGEPITWKDIYTLRVWKKPLLKRVNGFVLVRAFFIIPGQRWKIIRDINYALNSIVLSVWLSLRYSRFQKVIWFFEPFNIPGILMFFGSYIKVYDCVDFFPAFSEYARDSHVQLLQQADLVTANSSVLTQELQKTRPDAFTVPVGFSREIFPKFSNDNTSKSKRVVVGFLGSISTRLDFDLIGQVASLLPHVQFRFVGDLEPDVYGRSDFLYRRIAKLKNLNNITFLPRIFKEQIPFVLQSFDVAYIPYDAKNAFNRYCFPMKTMEYFYAGLPVVSSDIVELRRFKNEVFIAKSAKAMMVHIKRLKEKPWNASHKHHQRAIAMENSWENKIAKIVEQLHVSQKIHD